MPWKGSWSWNRSGAVELFGGNPLGLPALCQSNSSRRNRAGEVSPLTGAVDPLRMNSEGPLPQKNVSRAQPSQPHTTLRNLCSGHGSIDPKKHSDSFHRHIIATDNKRHSEPAGVAVIDPLAS